MRIKKRREWTMMLFGLSQITSGTDAIIAPF
jgi:hypothetical protein